MSAHCGPHLSTKVSDQQAPFTEQLEELVPAEWHRQSPDLLPQLIVKLDATELGHSLPKVSNAMDHLFFTLHHALRPAIMIGMCLPAYTK
jgi:hypothetical protein